jgi:hypothetical protein
VPQYLRIRHSAAKHQRTQAYPFYGH